MRVEVARGDYEHNRLPSVCVCTGEPTTDRIVLTTPTTRTRWSDLVLLTVLGPLALPVFYAAGANDTLTGSLALSEQAFGAVTAADRRRRLWVGLVAVALVAAVLAVTAGADPHPIAIAVIVGGMVGVALENRRGVRLPRVRPARKGTAVAIAGVHPRFAAAL